MLRIPLWHLTARLVVAAGVASSLACQSETPGTGGSASGGGNAGGHEAASGASTSAAGSTGQNGAGASTEAAAGAAGGGAVGGAPSVPSPSASGGNDTGFFLWDEATSAGAVEAAIAAGIRSFRSRDLTIVVDQPAWEVFRAHSAAVELMAAVPINRAWTETPVDLKDVAALIAANPFVRRLQVYPELQPGLLNPTELDPCKDWGDGAAERLVQRLAELDALVADKAVELLVAGQLAGAGCTELTQVFAKLYELQERGRRVAWGVTVYPFYYGDQDTSLATLKGDLDSVVAALGQHAPPGRAPLALRVLETGWASACNAKATPANQCAFVESALAASTNQGSGIKLYVFELQDYADGWSECEKHFGLFDVAGNNKCATCAGCVNPLP